MKIEFLISENGRMIGASMADRPSKAPIGEREIVAGIRTPIEPDLCRFGDLSTPTTAEEPIPQEAPALTKQRRPTKTPLSA